MCGITPLTLPSDGEERSVKEGRWLTFRAFLALGGGCRGNLVVAETTALATVLRAAGRGEKIPLPWLSRPHEIRGVAIGVAFEDH